MTDLEMLLTADEDARARLQSTQTALDARYAKARATADEDHHHALATAERALADELEHIAADVEQQVAGRAEARRERIAALLARAEAHTERAAALWMHILEEGALP